MPEQKKHRGPKIFIGCVIGATAIAALAVGGVNVYMRVAYSDFYAKAKAEFDTPALYTGFVPQDLAYAEPINAWLFSGYSDDEGPSPIWRMNPDGSLTSIKVIEPNGNVYHGHGGGFTLSGDFAYLTCENGFYVLKSSDLYEDGAELEVTAISKKEVGFDPAFINMQDGVLYTGVFYYEGPYSTPDKMHITAPDGTQNHAVMYAYEVDDSSENGVKEQPFAVYSIPDKAQGVAITPSNEMVFSTSWGVGASRIPFYSLDGIRADGEYEVNGEDIDLYFMDGRNFVNEVSAPPMMEGIVVHEGRLWLSNESACNKYIFGKLFGGATVFSLPL